jgi:hypothetical protein
VTAECAGLADTLERALRALREGRGHPLHGISATLLPYSREGAIDWAGFERHGGAAPAARA